MDSNIVELHSISKRLTALLEDPEPGLFTWQQAVETQMNKMRVYLGQEEYEAEIKGLKESLVLALTFYLPYSDERCDQWEGITGNREMCTKSMCDHIRIVLNIATDQSPETPPVIDDDQPTVGSEVVTHREPVIPGDIGKTVWMSDTPFTADNRGVPRTLKGYDSSDIASGERPWRTENDGYEFCRIVVVTAFPRRGAVNSCLATGFIERQAQ